MAWDQVHMGKFGRTNEGQELVTLTYGTSERLDMVEVTWPPVK